MAPIRSLLPPGGFTHLVGYHMAALDVGLAVLKETARALPADARERVAVPALESPAGILRGVGRREGAWIHAAVGRVPTPAEPAEDAALDALLGWLDAVRTVTLMVLRPLVDRDLERLVTLPGVEGPTTLRRLLVDLAERQARDRGALAASAALAEGGRRASPGEAP